MSKFFIKRPIVAMVVAILMVIVGAITILTLPVAQFPNIVPPEILLRATYPGADAQTLEQSVATPIEQQINGVDHMNYMYSLNATGNSQTELIVDFDVKTDPNTDLILTQSREQLATGQLPPEVNSYGHDPKVSHRTLDVVGLVFASRHARREVPGQLCVYQSPGSGCPDVRGRPGADFRRWAVCHEALGQAGPTGETRHHRRRYRQRHSIAEHGESGRPDRRP